MTIKDNTARVSFLFGDLKPGQAFREVANPDVLWMKTVASYSEDQLDVFNAVDLSDGELCEFMGTEDVIVVNAEIVVN